MDGKIKVIYVNNSFVNIYIYMLEICFNEFNKLRDEIDQSRRVYMYT